MSNSEPPTKKQKQIDASDAMVNAAAPPYVQPLEQVSQVRERIGKGLESSDGVELNCDIEQNIREIRAIISTNEEIYHRCMKSISIKRSDLRVF